MVANFDGVCVERREGGDVARTLSARRRGAAVGLLEGAIFHTVKTAAAAGASRSGRGAYAALKTNACAAPAQRRGIASRSLSSRVSCVNSSLCVKTGRSTVAFCCGGDNVTGIALSGGRCWRLDNGVVARGACRRAWATSYIMLNLLSINI